MSEAGSIDELKKELSQAQGKITTLLWRLGNLVESAEAFIVDPSNEGVAEQFAAEVASNRAAIDYWNKKGR